CTSLVNLVIPDSVTNIGTSSFYGCSGLTNLVLGNNLISIGNTAFLSCSSLTQVFVPPNIMSIGNLALHIGGLITVDPLNPAYSSQNGVLFDKNFNVLLDCPIGVLGSYTIPNTVASIEGAAFQSCTNLTAINIPSSITTISTSAFSSCSGLTNLVIPDSVTSFGIYAFLNCSQLQQVTTGNGITRIANDAFQNCSSLKNVIMTTNVTSIGSYAFASCGSLVSFSIPPYVTNIDSYAFAFDSSLISITLPDPLVSIGNFAWGSFAFYYCTSLKSVIVGQNLSYIPDGTFGECPSLTGIYFKGNAPTYHVNFTYGSPVTVYYLPGTSGWGTSLAGVPTAIWLPTMQTSMTVSNAPANPFGFNINWAKGMVVAVDAGTNLVKPVWQALGTNTLTSDTIYFSDPQSTNYPNRFYRLRAL
ncbi:MAG TPA: leucine-rich repeat domain-containing protein, partial [Candidatus Acidoferrum sp.]|nr:leucine-rich repeat domain-containing protein [Candidatus Acidoferrum sp.]